MQNLQTNLNTVMAESGFIVPDSYIGNTDQNAAQIVAMAQAAALSMAEQEWQGLRKQGSFTLTSATSYPLPSDFLGFVSGTLYQFGRWDAVDMPTTPGTWALLKSISGMATLPIRTRILAGTFQILNPQVGAVINYEYMSNSPITDQTGTTYKSQFTADTDIWTLDDRLFQLETKWRFKKEKGLEFNSDLQETNSRRLDVRARDNGNSTIIPNQVTVSGVPYANLWVTG